MYFGHYSVTDPWWTLFALANTGDVGDNVGLTAYDDDGNQAGFASEWVNGKGRLAEYVELLFGWR